ncbi:MAG: hypothetical protein KKE00_06470 [Proteobacteria bacterium]|nr:hypothetical protein [Pseudomonadota bacterium]MBU1570142.1 hypothetical protein [Pseudomonadota bacterium]
MNNTNNDLLSMHANPQLKFFLSGQTQPLEPNSKLWNLPLPVKRETTGIKADQNPSLSVTYGDYFEASGTFIIKNNYEAILNALSYIDEFICLEQIYEIKISLEKHGPFYHPSKIEAVTENSVIPFVLNVAVSKIGIECIHKEFFTLKKLNSEFSNSFIPAVYGQDDFNGRDNLKIGMFLGEWFEGYSEFHISKDPSDGKEKILIWGNLNGNLFVSADKAIEIYRQASMIMTCFYNVHTFEQIFPWHHAAGDFVVKQTDDALDVKLITARQYSSLFQTKVQTKDQDLIFEGLLMFLVVLSIRMRLDRINGTGDIVWAHNMSVDGTIKGFREGIKIKTRSGVIPYNFIDEFRIYLQSRSENELFELSKAIIGSFNQSAPDMPVIRRNLAKHSSELYHAVKNL